jgi:hypothetical protein
VVTGGALRYSSLVNTLCHELAHLRHFHHGPEFQDFYQRLLRWARRQGIYRPAPRRPATGEREPEDALLGGEELRATLEAMRAMIAPSPAAPASPRPDAPVQLSLFGDEA